MSSDISDFSPSPKKKTTQLLKPKTTKVTKAQPKKKPLSSISVEQTSYSSSSSPVKPQSSITGKKKTIEEIYQKKTQLEHILLRPDSYIGSTEAITTPLWVLDASDKMVYRSVTYVPGLYKIFDEIIVNAADNKVRDPNMDTIKVTIDRENNVISVYNNGRGIPIEMHAKENVHVPELIFGHLLTSSNYDDNEKKVTGGRNGYGAKLCNIFSTEFIVETADKKTARKFKQVYTNNMSNKTVPDIKPNSKNEEYTKITFKPDLNRFHMESIDNDFEALLKKRVYDLAGCCRGVKVFLNDNRIKIKDFKDYIDLYLSSKSEGEGMNRQTIIYETDKKRWEVAFALSDGQFQQVSFVNSICTSKGGTHVNYIADQLVTHLIEAVKKKDKKGAPVKPFQVKNHLWLFVNSSIENPTFDSQTKETLTLRASGFGSKFTVSEEFIKKVMKSGVVDNILKFVHFKENQLLKKTDGAKKSRITGILKLDDANNAGTRLASKCTLILTEGDSAKALAVSGLSVVGRDNFGVFPLRGKLLNVREASHSQITSNAEINAIKQILGLQHGKVYENTDSLRYGHLMIMTDQDHDGSHIKGLIINFLDHFWPSLLKIPGFLLEFITPIVKVSKGKGNNHVEQSFFTIPEYEVWKEAHLLEKEWTIKYYKGLGTSTTADAKKYFSDLNKHLKPFSECSTEERQLVDMAFNKKKADDRKEWLRQFQAGTFMDHRVSEIPIGDFINKELILFSMADNIRSIPSVMDGFKPGQRKILFACFKRKLKDEIKVAQLAGYVSEHAAYHHGEQSLCSTIVNMAQNYVGSNNLNFLEPLGQFGTRLQGGKDAASARYIFTNLTPFARLCFHPADDALLKTLTDDGQSIEPEWYLPILPMILVNGSDGIGTGWSSNIPNYNPRDIVSNIHRYMKGEELVDLHPWYRGYTGRIENIGKDKYKITGTITKIDDVTVEITELPLKSWTQNYKETLEEWLQGTDKVPAWIKDYKEYHTDTTVHFIVTLTEANMAMAEKEGLEVKFKLTSQISTTNLVCFDQQGRIRKYSNVNDILSDFCQVRLEFYQKRKQYLLNQLTLDLTRLENRVRFIQEIVSGSLKVQNRKRVDLIQDLKTRGYEPFSNNKTNPKNAKEDDVSMLSELGSESRSSSSDSNGYDYLMSMPIWSLTMEKIDALLKEKQGKEAELKYLIGQTVHDLWRNDLDGFLAQWDSFEKILSEVDSSNKGKAVTKGKGLTLSKPKSKPKKKKDDSDVSMDDDDDDFEQSSKKKKMPKASSLASSTTSSLMESKPSSSSNTKKASISGVSKTVGKTKVTKKESTQPIDSYFKETVSPVANSLDQLSLDAASSSTVTGSKVVGKKRALPGKKVIPAKTLISSQVNPSNNKKIEEDLDTMMDIESSDSEDLILDSVASSKPVSLAQPLAKKTTLLPSSKAIIISSSDSEIEDADIIKAKVTLPRPRKAVVTKAPVYTVDDSDDTITHEDDSEEEEDFSEEDSDFDE